MLVNGLFYNSIAGVNYDNNLEVASLRFQYCNHTIKNNCSEAYL